MCCFRLEAYDRNFNFQPHSSNSVEAEQDEDMVLPDEGNYRDVNSNTLLPPLDNYQVQQYFEE